MKKRMNGLRKKALCFGLSLAVVLGTGIWAAAPAMAADEPYNYTIRIYSGAKGTYNGQEVTVLTRKPGERVDIDAIRNTVLPDDSKYYVMGARESGLDNNDPDNPAVATASFPATEDADYVIAYGMKDKTVAYTINYVDAAGNRLADSETYYGNIGDKPVIAFLYVDGYQPQAYNLTKTLSENEGENQFTFVYTAITSETAATTGTDTGTGETAAAGTGTAGGTGTGTTGTAGTGTAGGAGTGDAGTAGAGGTAGAAGTGTGDAGATEPSEVVDLDDQDVPLAGYGNGNGNGDDSSAASEETINDDKPPLHGLSVAAKTGIAVIVAAAVVLLIIALALRARRRKKEEEL